MSLLIGDKTVVSMHYTLTDNDGNVIDSSEGKEPLTYLHGANNIIPGLEKELLGKTAGAAVTAKVTPEEGYGEINPDLIQTVDIGLFQGVEEVKAGMSFTAQTPSGQQQQVEVKSVEGDEVTIDANHPLAGVHLNFDVSIVDVREATEEELAHGHAH